jgi:hypothetical protein
LCWQTVEQQFISALSLVSAVTSNIKSMMDIQLIKDTFKGLRRKYALVERKSDIKKDFLDFLDNSFLLSHYRTIDYYNAYSFSTSDNHEALIFTILVSYSVPSGKFDIGGFDVQLLAVREFPNFFGQILIRPETVSDKISEWFQKAEIDFPENPKFSRNYYCLSKNLLLAREFATKKRLTELEKHKDIYFEIRENKLMAKFQRGINFQDGSSLIELLINL